MTELDTFETRFAAAYGRYLDRAPRDVDAAAVARSVMTQPRSRVIAWPWTLRPAGALAWMLLIAALLAVLMGAAFIGSRLLETVPPNVTPTVVPSVMPQPQPVSAALAATGVDILTPDGGSYSRLVADGQGVLWATQSPLAGLGSEGRLARFDPATNTARTWSVADDAAFASTSIAPARAGGVWLASGSTLRWFDGAVFREVIAAPYLITAFAEAPDATLWAATIDLIALHWDGSTWRRLDLGSHSDTEVTAIAADDAGGVWIGWAQRVDVPLRVSVSHYDGQSWTDYDGFDTPPLGGTVSSIAQLPDGGIWVTTSSGLARFDGSSWSDETAHPTQGETISVAGSPDGTIWTVEEAHWAGDQIRLRRFDGQEWRSYGSADGLPPSPQRGAAEVVATATGVYVGTGDGIFRLSGERWERVWPASSAPQEAYLQILLAVSHDELWASRDGLWHFQNGVWTSGSTGALGSYPVEDLVLAPDGTLWATGPFGLAYRRTGEWEWTSFGDWTSASAIAVGDNGVIWVAGDAPGPPTACELATLRLDGTAWVKTTFTGCPADFEWMGPPQSIGIDAQGMPWVGIPQGWGGGLARFNGQSWETIDKIDAYEVYGATVLGRDPQGAIWVDMQTYDGWTGANFHMTGRFDGSNWSVGQLPGDRAAFLAADGTLWAHSWSGPARFDGSSWTYPYEGLQSVGLLGGVAPDGTLFGSSDPDLPGVIYRYPSLAP